MASSSPSSSSPPPLVEIATSSEETLLLTRTGEVLVCRHVDAADDNQNGVDDTVDDEDGILAFDIDNISKNQSSELLDDSCSLNANSFEASITGRNKLHREKQRHSLQKAWAECCEPERFCDLATSDKNYGNQRGSSGRGGGLLGGSEDHLDTAKLNYNDLVNGMSSKLNIIDHQDVLNEKEKGDANNNDWNTVSPKRRKKLQQQQKLQQPKLQQQTLLLQTPPRRRGKKDSSPSSTINNFGSNDDSDDEEEEEHDENPDRININDVQLQDHNNFTFIGGSGGSPTPMLSFDYTGYEPPTPEKLFGTMNDDGSCTSTEATFSMAGLPPSLPSITLASFTTATTSSHQKGKDGGTMTMNGQHHQEQQHLNEEQQQLLQQQKQQRRRRSIMGSTSSVLSGIPTFLHHLSQIRITHLSAHPRGHHVLLISEEGLLFSYGSNECGQLGLGRFHKKGGGGGGREIVTIPSIVTPLLENGGKTVNCAAGVDYSLVVVRIEGSRLAHRRYNNESPSSSPGNNSPNDCNIHHQMYGFGNNEHMKLGLLDPDGNGRRRDNNVGGNFTTPRRSRVENADLDSPASASLSCCFSTPESFATLGSGIEDNDHTQANYVFLPRRVALHCRVISRKGINPVMKQSQTDLPLEYGIFNVAASSDHSAALVRRPSGAVELYSWGRGDALRQPAYLEDDIPSPRRWECVPVLKPQKKKMQNGLTIVTPTLVTTLSSLHESQASVKSGAPPRFHSPRKESRQRSPGKPLSNSENRDETKSLLNPTEYLVNVALGPSCTHVVTSSGRWFAFGSSDDGLLGLGADTTTSHVPTEVKLAGSETIQSISIGEKHAVAVSSQGHAYMWGRCQHDIAEDNEPVSSPQPISFADKMPTKTKTLEDALIRHIGLDASSRTNNASGDADGVVYAHAGRDLSVFVLESGSVLTCGKKSGRLGQGDVSMDVNSPRQMFGGLQLWRND